MDSRSRMPKSCKIWRTGLAPRSCSAWTSSYCKSSIRPFSLINSNNGLAMGSDMGLALAGFGGVLLVHGLGQLEFLQFRLDGHGILGLGNNFLAGDQAGHVFFDEVTVKGDHAVFGVGLNVRVEPEGFVRTNQGGDGRRVDHDFKNRHAAG